MVKQFHDTPPNPYTTTFSEQDVKDFYKHMHTKKGGCYSYSSVVWSEMCNQHPNLVVELQVERSSKLSEERQSGIQPTTPWPNNAKEQLYFDKICELQSKVNKFPWEGIGIGFAIGSLFWGIMFGLFGG